MNEINDLRHLSVMGSVLKDEYIAQTCTKAIAALESAATREAELRARVTELENIVSDCQIMGFLQPKSDASPTHRDLVKRADAAMAKGGV